MSSLYEKSIISTMENIYYWLNELEEDMEHGVFVLSPSTFITTWLHDLIITRMTYGNEDLDWAKVCEEAKKQAKLRKEKENAKNNR